MARRDSNFGSALVIGSGALVAWWLLHGRQGGRPGRGRQEWGHGAQPAATPCRVHVDATGIEVDGKRADLARTVSACGAVGAADVTATGAAIVGAIRDLLRALQDAGVIVSAAPALWDVAGLASSARGSQ